MDEVSAIQAKMERIQEENERIEVAEIRITLENPIAARRRSTRRRERDQMPFDPYLGGRRNQYITKHKLCVRNMCRNTVRLANIHRTARAHVFKGDSDNHRSRNASRRLSPSLSPRLVEQKKNRKPDSGHVATPQVYTFF